MMKIRITSKEFGRGKGTVKTFSTLAAAQQYVRDRWQGVEYVDGPADFHTDYCTYHMTGCTLKDLGHRASYDPADDAFWNWVWVPFVKADQLTALRTDDAPTSFTTAAQVDDHNERGQSAVEYLVMLLLVFALAAVIFTAVAPLGKVGAGIFRPDGVTKPLFGDVK